MNPEPPPPAPQLPPGHPRATPEPPEPTSADARRIANAIETGWFWRGVAFGFGLTVAGAVAGVVYAIIISFTHGG